MVNPIGAGSTSNTAGQTTGAGTSASSTTAGGLVGSQTDNAINFAGLSTGIDTNQIIQEMLAIDRQPEQIYQGEMQLLQQRQTVYNSISAQLLSFQAAAYPLDSLRAFDLVTASTSDNTVATVSAQTGAQTGTHTITVNALAQAQMISTAAQSSQAAPLNMQGQILINGKAINVQSADSLQSLASNINAAQAGVTASIISPSPGQLYLTIGSNNAGLQGQISIADVGGGNLLSQLGLFGTGGSIKHQLTSASGSDLFTDSATSVATLEGLTNPAVGSVQIQLNNGAFQTVSIDLTHSLGEIASDINTALGSNVATVQTVTDPISGSSGQQLQIAGATGFVDNNNVLAALGVYQENLGAGRELTQARDASFTLDGLAATRPTNSFSDAISGVTINLLKDASSTGSGSGSGGTSAAPTTTITIAADTSTIKTNIQAFVKSFNDTIDAINNQSQYDSTTGQTGPLFGDATMQSVMASLTESVTSQVAGLPSNMSVLSQIGITLDQSNHLNINDAALTQALQTNLHGAAKLFQAFGQPSDPNVQFVSGTASTQPSTAAGYAVQITQPATQATYTVPTAQTQPLLTDEVLTFGGPLFGTAGTTTPPLQGPTVTLHAGSSAADIVSQINADANVNAALSASLDAQGRLTLTSKEYGSQAQFDVVSSVAAATNSTGIGQSIVSGTGQDVQGTINGEPATGSGQYLTGSLQGSNGGGNGQALGLQLRITATQPGSYGTVVYTSGVADAVKNYINIETDPYSGVLTTAVQSMQTQYTNDQTAINDIEQNLTIEQQNLQNEFTNMETSVANLKAASAGLSQLGGSLLPTSG